MNTTKIALALVAVVGLSTIIVGLTFAHYTSTNPFAPATGYVSEDLNEDWWTKMREYMETRWRSIEDEEWYDDMVNYMEEHWDEVQTQEWFNQMLEYMEQQGYSRYSYRNYEGNYYGPRYFGRRGCWGW